MIVRVPRPGVPLAHSLVPLVVSVAARDVLGADSALGAFDGNTALLRDVECRFLVDGVEVFLPILAALPVLARPDGRRILCPCENL